MSVEQFAEFHVHHANGSERLSGCELSQKRVWELSGCCKIAGQSDHNVAANGEIDL